MYTLGNKLPIPVMEIIRALEGEAGNTDTDPRWRAANELRRMEAVEQRTLMCSPVDVPKSTFLGREPDQEVGT